MLEKAIFLDRDGTINEDPGYLNDPRQVVLLPTVGEALALLKKRGYFFIVVSNQSGVSRGSVTEDGLSQICKRIGELLMPWFVEIQDYFFCYHLPDAHCECRKPRPKMLFDAARKYSIDLSQSYMVGDKISDIQTGILAGCKASLLTLTGWGKQAQTQSKGAGIAYSGNTLLDIAQWVLKNS